MKLIKHDLLDTIYKMESNDIKCYDDFCRSINCPVYRPIENCPANDFHLCLIKVKNKYTCSDNVECLYITEEGKIISYSSIVDDSEKLIIMCAIIKHLK